MVNGSVGGCGNETASVLLGVGGKAASLGVGACWIYRSSSGLGRWDELGPAFLKDREIPSWPCAGGRENGRENKVYTNQEGVIVRGQETTHNHQEEKRCGWAGDQPRSLLSAAPPRRCLAPPQDPGRAQSERSGGQRRATQRVLPAPPGAASSPSQFDYRPGQSRSQGKTSHFGPLLPTLHYGHLSG